MGNAPWCVVNIPSIIFSTSSYFYEMSENFRLEARYEGRFLHHIEPLQFLDSVECDTLLCNPTKHNIAEKNFHQVLYVFVSRLNCFSQDYIRKT